MQTDKLIIEKSLTFNLNEISKWQLDYDGSAVKLPALQRGFVWKAGQIETLWDSLLRGFPIGSFLLSRSEDKKLFLLDGQQRATSIAIGFYNPWDKIIDKENNFWSLKNIPIVWIDLAPKEKTNTQKFVIRVITLSHPWGYQRKDNNLILSVSDRRNALKIFRMNPDNKDGAYIQLSPLKVFPYDSDLPVPLSFLLKSIKEQKENWKEKLIELCRRHLPRNIITKNYINDEINYTDKLKAVIYSSEFDESIYNAIVNLEQVEVPAITIKQEILKAEDEQTGEDPTLFVRLNSSGTRIAGEELIYSIYKASFPEAKELVENIGASFIAPSLTISLVSRLALAEINENNYPYSINVNDFRKRIKDDIFKSKLRELIGTESNSPSGLLFKKAFEILLSKHYHAIPPVLVKSFVKGSPDIFLMLLQWIKLHNGEVNNEDQKSILAAFTALSWFGRDNTKYVRELWNSISKNNFWTKEVLSIPYLNKRDYIMYPMIKPSTLRRYLLQSVVTENVNWDNLYPSANDEIVKTYNSTLSNEIEHETELTASAMGIWENFMNKLFWCKPLVLFAQRKYINDSFGEFNQLETLEDTNTPWDWDHIYPASWVYYKKNINQNVRHWTNSIGNFRAMSLEENRSENDSFSPCERLINVREQSFIKENDWLHWSKINGVIKDVDHEMIKHHLSAIVHRLCNIYEEWYETLDIGNLFYFEPQNNTSE